MYGDKKYSFTICGGSIAILTRLITDNSYLAFYNSYRPEMSYFECCLILHLRIETMLTCRSPKLNDSNT